MIWDCVQPKKGRPFEHFLNLTTPPSNRNRIFGSFYENEPLADLGHLPEYPMATDLKLLILSCLLCSFYMNKRVFFFLISLFRGGTRVNIVRWGKANLGVQGQSPLVGSGEVPLSWCFFRVHIMMPLQSMHFLVKR